MYICIYVYMYICIYVYMYIYIYIYVLNGRRRLRFAHRNPSGWCNTYLAPTGERSRPCAALRAASFTVTQLAPAALTAQVSAHIWKVQKSAKIGHPSIFNGYKKLYFRILASFGLYRPQMRKYIALIHFNMPYATFIPTIVCLDLPLEAMKAQTGPNGYISWHSGHPGRDV